MLSYRVVKVTKVISLKKKKKNFKAMQRKAKHAAESSETVHVWWKSKTFTLTFYLRLW